MTVSVVSVDHRGVAPGVRARLVLDASQVERGLSQLAVLHPDVEALVLATCARTELVLAGEHAADAAGSWHVLFAAGDGGAGTAPCAHGERRVLHGAAAVRHVLRVTAGLDSPLLGDVDVLRQVRTAAARARAAHTLGSTLTRLVDDALALGRRARATTDIAAGGPGITAAITAELTRSAPTARRVLVVGAGAVAHGVVGGLSAETEVVVANRTVARATDLVAGRPGARATGLDALPEELAAADAVVLAAAGGPLLSSLDVAEAALIEREVLIVDAGAPRAVAPTSGLRLVDLEQLQARRDATTDRREAAVPAVEALVEETVEAWRASLDRTAVEGAIARLYRAAPDLVAEVADAADSRTVELAVKRFLHEHVTTLRQVSAAE